MTPPPAPVLELEAPATESVAPPKKRRGRPPLPKERPTSQINARIDSELKTQGDAALERAGFSPTAAIRALWTLAIQLDNQPGALAAILDPDRDKPTEEQLAERARKVKLVQRAPQLVFENLIALGCTARDITQAIAGLSDDELQDLTYEEHRKEREARSK